MNKLLALVAVAVLVLAGCSSGTDSTSNENQMSVGGMAAVVEHVNNSYMNVSSPYYLTATSDSYTLARDTSVSEETKNEVPMNVNRLFSIAPAYLFDADTISTTNDYYSYFNQVDVSPVNTKVEISGESTTYAPGLYNVGIDIPAGSYTLDVIDSTNSVTGSYSIYSSDSKELVEKNLVFGSKVIQLENGQYLQTYNTTITSN